MSEFQEVSQDRDDIVTSTPSLVDKEPTPWRDRLQRYKTKPLNRIAAVLSTTLLLIGGDKVVEQRAIPDIRAVDSSVTFVLGDQERTNVTYIDWQNMQSDKSLPLITPDSEIQKLISTEEPATNELFPKLKIDDPESFTTWVQQQTERPDLRGEVKLFHGAEPTAKQLVDLSVAIVISNLSYAENPRKDKQEVYKLPIDEILQNSIPMQCEGYAYATKTVFDEMKKAHPDILKNTYMTTHSGIAAGHMWNSVIDVKSPTEANLYLIDPTADDPDYREGFNGHDYTNFMDGVEGLFKKGVINGNAYFELAAQYEKSGNMTANELEEIFTDEWGITDRMKDRTGNNILTASYVHLAEALLAHPDIGEENLNKQKRNEIQLDLYRYYINPNSQDRPDNWYERAHSLAEKIIMYEEENGVFLDNEYYKAQFEEYKNQILNIPKTSDEFKKLYPNGLITI